MIDFKRRKSTKARSSVSNAIRNRTAFIRASIPHADGEKAYIIAPQRLAAGVQGHRL